MKQLTLQTPRSEKAGREGAPGTKAVVETMVRQSCHPVANGGLWWSRYPLAAHGGSHARAGEWLKESVTLWEAHPGPGYWQYLWTHGERSSHWSRLVDKTCEAPADSCWSSLLLKEALCGRNPR